MRIKGLNAFEEEVIKDILKPFFAVYDFYYYGSRVKGDFRSLSDLDILSKGKTPMLPDDCDTLKELFDASNLPFIVNIVDFHLISNTFYNDIKKDLVSVFQV